jgi:hypothetical protein
VECSFVFSGDVSFGPYIRRQVVAYLPGVLGVGLIIYAVMKEFTRKWQSWAKFGPTLGKESSDEQDRKADGLLKKTPEHNWASHGADARRYLSLSWRAPMREPEPEKKPAGIPLPDRTFDQFMELEDEPERFGRVWPDCTAPIPRSYGGDAQKWPRTAVLRSAKGG